MNTKRILSWGAFVLVIGLIIWGMIAASKKAERESMGIASVDQITANDWIKGATSSPYTLVEYSDFQCPACGAYFPLVEQVVTENSENITFVYRHFPLTQHKNAVPAAQAAEAAGKQGKFWEMYSMLFEKQADWAEVSDIKTILSGYATTLKLDIEKFNTDYESQEVKDAVNADYKSGLKAGVNSTPTFYLNGKKVNFQTNEQFKKLLEDTYTTAKNS